LHTRARAEGARGRHVSARRLLRAALKQHPDPVPRAHILLSLAYYEAEQSGLAAGLALLDEADQVAGLPTRVRGLVASQRGLLYMRVGQAAQALAGLDTALRLLDESDPEGVCRALLNRSDVHIQLRDLTRARADLARCVDVAGRHGLDVIGAKASHNLGYWLMLAGDLPGALREMDAVAPTLGALSPAMAAVYYVDRAQVLLAAGLFREADDDLAHAVELLRAGRVQQDRAEAELARAQVALVEERWADARRLARQARRRFTARGADVWNLLAEQVSLAAAVGSGRGLAAAATAGAQLAAALAGAGLADEARRTTLTATLAALGAGPGTDNGARERAGPALTLRNDDPIATRLQARMVRARLADADGRPDRADAELRAALHDLHRYQSSFGSLDLQTAVSGHGRRLAGQGLARALASGRPAAVFGWAERARALSTRLAPVVPPEDPEAARLLEELRHARVRLQGQVLARRVDPQLRARCAHLERQVRQRAWYRPGPGQVTAPAPLGRLREYLATHDATLVAHLLSGGRVHALVAGARTAAVLDLGAAPAVLELHRRLRADLDVLAARNVPVPIRASVRAASRSSLRGLDDLLWRPLRRRLTGGPLLLAPAAGLATVPWTLLPSVAGRPASVVASVTAWLAARDRAARDRAALAGRPAVAFAVGPHVPRAMEELRLVTKEWPHVSALSGAEATAAAVRAAAGVVDVLHVAAHGVHEPDNPLFSYLELADGPLFGHELDHLPRLPAHVVLSACELGLAGTRPGDETLGMTAALLHGGARSVVAGVARIADEAACRVGAAHHAGLRQGLPPAAALADALRAEWGEDPVPLVCFGAGW
jgi:tetratricopeptide (TPR) repeat protein